MINLESGIQELEVAVEEDPCTCAGLLVQEVQAWDSDSGGVLGKADDLMVEVVYRRSWKAKMRKESGLGSLPVGWRTECSSRRIGRRI